MSRTQFGILMSDLSAISFPTDLTRVVTLMYSRLYGRAKTPSDLPWYREEPQDLLAEIEKTRKRLGRALDVGCGSGMHAVWLAQQAGR